MWETVVTGWHLFSGKERGGSDGVIVTDRATLAARQRAAHRAAVDRGRRQAASIVLAGLPGSAFTENEAAPSCGRYDGGGLHYPAAFSDQSPPPRAESWTPNGEC